MYYHIDIKGILTITRHYTALHGKSSNRDLIARADSINYKRKKPRLVKVAVF